MKFRKKPVVIEAVQFFNGDGPPNTLAECKAFCSEIVIAEDNCVYGEIETLEGVMIVSDGDWIIKGVNGEFYPCKPDIFEKTYDKVEDQ